MARMPEAWDETLVGVGGVEELVHVVAVFDGGNVEGFFLVAAQDFQLQHLIETVKVQGGRKLGKGFDAALVGHEDDILNLQAGGGGGAVRLDVGDDDSPVLGELEAFGQRGGNFLSHCADLHAMDVAVLAQAVIDEIHDAGGYGEAQAFTATALRKNECVDAENRSIHIDQRSAAVAGVDGSIGLDIGEGLVGIGLTSDGADYSHGDGVLQALGTADGENELTYARTMLGEQGKRREILFIDLEQGKISLFVGADQAGLEDAASARRDGAAVVSGQGQSHADALRTFDYVIVGDDVAVGVDDDSGADGVLAHDERGLGAAFFVQRTVSGDDNLDYRGRYFGGETFQSIVDLHESGGGGGGFVRLGLRLFLCRVLLFFCGCSWVGGRLLGHQACGCGQNERGQLTDSTLRAFVEEG